MEGRRQQSSEISKMQQQQQQRQPAFPFYPSSLFTLLWYHPHPLHFSASFLHLSLLASLKHWWWQGDHGDLPVQLLCGFCFLEKVLCQFLIVNDSPRWLLINHSQMWQVQQWSSSSMLACHWKALLAEKDRMLFLQFNYHGLLLGLLMFSAQLVSAETGSPRWSLGQWPSSFLLSLHCFQFLWLPYDFQLSYQLFLNSQNSFPVLFAKLLFSRWCE